MELEEFGEDDADRLDEGLQLTSNQSPAAANRLKIQNASEYEHPIPACVVNIQTAAKVETRSQSWKAVVQATVTKAQEN